MSFMGNIKCLSSESSPPDPPGKDVLRIYSARFSPFAERVKLVLHAKGIEHETVNIDLVNKPTWFGKKNPHEQVPVIERNGSVLYESSIICNYLDKVFPGRKLTTEDPLQLALEEIILYEFSPVIPGLTGYVLSTDSKDGYLAKMQSGVSQIIPLLENGNLFLCGDKPGMTDYLAWPLLERIELYATSLISGEPLIQEYFDRMGKDESVIACRLPAKMILEFYKSYAAGTGDCDYGLE